MTPEEKKVYMHEKYLIRKEYLKSQKCCLQCKKQDERTLQGFVRCEECAIKDKIYHIKRKRGMTDDR